jgi:hypothetical protein
MNNTCAPRSRSTVLAALAAATCLASTTAAQAQGEPSAQAPADGAAAAAVRLGDLSSRVDDLRDKLRRSQAALALISEAMGDSMAAARSEISIKDEMSSAFRLTRAVVVLDGSVLYHRDDETGALADQREIPLFAGSIAPGDHTVTVALTFRGNGYGVFTYLRGYTFDVKSSHSFTAAAGKTIQVTASALERGTVTTPLEQRPGLEWREKLASEPAAAVRNAASVQTKP